MSFPDKEPAHSGSAACTFHADDIAASRRFRESYESRLNVVKAEDMPWERSPDGLIKHLVHHRMNTRECCVEAYMQFLAPGERSGRHRHMWEEIIFVVEGSGHDLLQLATRFTDSGVAALIVTEIHRDGTMEGPSLDQLRAVLEVAELPVIASGGIGGLGDLQALAALQTGGRGLEGAIVGRALYEGRFTFAEAREAVS